MREEQLPGSGSGSSGRSRSVDPAAVETPTAEGELRILLLPQKLGPPAVAARTRRPRRPSLAAEEPSATASLNIGLLPVSAAESGLAGKKARTGRQSAASSPTATAQLTIFLLSDARAQLNTEARRVRAKGRLAAGAAVAAVVAIIAGTTILESHGLSRQVIFIGATVLVATLGTAVGFYLSLRRKQGASAALGDLSEMLFNELPGTTSLREAGDGNG